MFEGSTCSHCAELKAFFGDLASDEEYKDKFELQEYEIWHDTDNKELIIIPDATHVDLYDNMEKIPFDKIEEFFKKYLR